MQRPESGRWLPGSYDHHGRRFVWRLPSCPANAVLALDVEARDNPSAARLGARFGLDSQVFLQRWTATEAVSKALDAPVLDLLRRHGLEQVPGRQWSQNDRGVWLCGLDHPTLWVTVAVLFANSSGLAEEEGPALLPDPCCISIELAPSSRPNHDAFSDGIWRPDTKVNEPD
jgi:hypothetical protein